MDDHRYGDNNKQVIVARFNADGSPDVSSEQRRVFTMANDSDGNGNTPIRQQ